MENMLNMPPAALLAEAQALREQVWGKQVLVRGIVEFSNHCQQNCLYCGLRRDNRGLARYRLSVEEIVEQARLIKVMDIGTVVLQSGEDPAYDEAAICDIIKRIKDELGLAVTLSLGERQPGELKSWRAAGADRYLLKVETFAQPNYQWLRPGCSLEQRLSLIKNLQDLGYETGSGLISGLPWQNLRALGQDLAKLNQLKLNMISISPFCPHPQTPLAEYMAASAQENLLALAVARIANPKSNIPITSALALYGDDIRNQALSQTANVIMFSFTPEPVRSAYNIYPGKNLSPLSPHVRARAICNALKEKGFELPGGPGNALNLEHGHG